MSLTLIFILILFALNVPFLIWSNRKRKYGIYPGWISILTFVLLLGYYSSVMIMNSRAEPPAVKSFKKGTAGMQAYNKSMLDYGQKNIEAEQKIAQYLNYVPNFFLAVKIQCFIAFSFSIFGLLYVSNRNRFYWMLILIYTIVLTTLFFAEWFGSLR